MTYPTWYGLALLALAAFRCWKLVGDDVILDRPRGWAVRATKRKWGNAGGDYLVALLECPWCAGFWISLAWWGGFELSPHWATIVAVPFAISALVGLLGHLISD